MIGDKWTLLVARDLANGPKRTMELHSGLFPISSRTLVGRLRDMEKDRLVIRKDLGGNPPHIEYELTERGHLLLPLIDSLRELGESLGCNECEDRKQQLGFYCEACPHKVQVTQVEPVSRSVPAIDRRRRDDSIVLL